MKKVLSILLTLVLSLTFIQVANADEGISALSLSCPSKVSAGEVVTCSLTANVSSNVTRIAGITVQRVTGGISDVQIEREDLSYGTNIKLATVKLDTSTSGGVGQVVLSVNYYDKNNGSDLLTATVKSRDIKIVSGSGGSSSGSSSSGSNSGSSSNRLVNKNSKLKNLKVDGKTVTGFSRDVKTYSLNSSDASATITATAVSSSASIRGTGTKTLECGNNNFSVVVTNGSSKTTYTLVIKRTCNTNVYLSDIEVSSGTLSPKFNKNISNYIVKVGRDIETITVTGKKSNSNQTVIGNVVEKKLKAGSNKIRLTVTTAAGAKRSYIVNVIKESRDALLQSLTISDGELTFDKNRFDYNIEVLNNVNSIEVLAIPEDSAATVTVNGNDKLQTGDNIITIKVELENAKTRIYTIKVNKLKPGETFGTNPNIKNIEVVGYAL